MKPSTGLMRRRENSGTTTPAVARNSMTSLYDSGAIAAAMPIPYVRRRQCKPDAAGTRRQDLSPRRTVSARARTGAQPRLRRLNRGSRTRLGGSPWRLRQLVERLRKVGDEIVGVLDADRDADGRIGHAEAVAGCLRHARVGRRCRVAGERLR